jgi:hypothetical protein
VSYVNDNSPRLPRTASEFSAVNVAWQYRRRTGPDTNERRFLFAPSARIGARSRALPQINAVRSNVAKIYVARSPNSFRTLHMTKLKLTLVAISALGGLAVATDAANAVVYCTYIGYPVGCVVRPGIPLVARPVTVPRAGNINGGVNRVGRR